MIFNCLKGVFFINFLVVFLGVLSSAMFLYYWGKSGYDYDGKKDEGEE